MIPSYLSIDLDYWNGSNEEIINSFFDKIFSFKLPMLVVESHENILKDVNKSDARVLYNIDFHSDFIGDSTKRGYDQYIDGKPKDCDWVNHVAWRHNGTYVWLHPSKECFRNKKKIYPEGEGACWGYKKDNPFEKGYHDWENVKHYTGTKKVEWDSICGIGISLSQDYLLGKYHPFDNLVSKLKVKRRFYNTLADRHCFDSRWKKIINP